MASASSSASIEFESEALAEQTLVRLDVAGRDLELQGRHDQGSDFLLEVVLDWGKVLIAHGIHGRCPGLT